MGMQEVLVAIVFMAAVWYVGRMIYRNAKSEKGCSSGCGKCGIDFSQIEKKQK